MSVWLPNRHLNTVYTPKRRVTYPRVRLSSGWAGWYRNRANEAKRKAKRAAHKFQRSARAFGVTR